MPQPTQDYNRFVNQLIVELPGATDAGIRQAAFDVFHEFFEETNVWQEDIVFTTTANVVDYTLNIAEGGEFVRLMVLINSLSAQQVCVSDLVGNITLRDTPSVSDTFTAIVSKTIGMPLNRDGTPQIPDWTISRFEPILRAGVIGFMMMQSKKPYSNQAMGLFWTRKFRDKLGKVKSAVIHGNLYGVNSWSYPQGFKTPRASQRFGSGGTDQSFGAV